MITTLIARKQKKLQEIDYSADISAASYMYLKTEDCGQLNKKICNLN